MIPTRELNAVYFSQMQIRSATFLVSAPNLDACPPSAWPEFAFIGRSNVGKSSLLNLIAGTTALAKVSTTPGHTQLINFFSINNAWTLVDLPGYGYARTLKQGQVPFEEMISGYLSRRSNLARVFVLIDSRHSPQLIDLEFIQWLSGCQVPFALVFTKADKSKPTLVQANIESFGARLGDWSIDPPAVFITSAQTKAGRNALLAYIQKALG